MGYSQHGEDLIVAKLFDERHIEAGNLIDVGAYEPKDLSNSRLLIERGWDATLIEFTPMAVKDLVREYADNPNVRVIQCALTASPQHVQEFRVTDDGLSSNDPGHAKKWAHFNCGYYGKLWVPTLTVRQIVDQFYGDKPIDFVSIDTEGTSLDLAVEFMSLDGDWRPRVICVEHDDRDAELMSFAQRLGYRLEWRSEGNAILVVR